MIRLLLALAMIVASFLTLEAARRGVAIMPLQVGQTPVTRYAKADADGPVVVVAHGFAGSQQMMQGYVLPLARAGYRVYVFEFLGHGRHPAPMSGDVNAIDGTTRLLVAQTNAVVDALAAEESVALIGHSMATDILVRVAAEREDIGPVALISAFSKAIDATTPETLLLIAGAWEPGLRSFAGDALRMVDARAMEGDTVTNGPVTRRAVVAPFTEHVSVLQSRVGRGEALVWLDRAYSRDAAVTTLPTGWAILGLLFGLVLSFGSVAKLLPAQERPQMVLTAKQFAIALLIPAALTPLIAVPLNPEILPVLVADYLGLHLFIFGLIQLALLWFWRVKAGWFSLVALAMLLLWCVLFGVALDRYAANFWPTPQRLWIIAVMMLGAVPYMMADSILTTDAGFLRRLAIRISFLASLGIAVVLDFEGLFFLIMIAPVLVLFYLVFGTMGRAAAVRAGPLSSGLALGLVLAWALGVSFPLFQA